MNNKVLAILASAYLWGGMSYLWGSFVDKPEILIVLIPVSIVMGFMTS